ncbi:hypothetical protein M436DRAFT_86250 [Aureobasidium namibiae CBS 147.97]|uniref:Uncharacterized protein n=1 Tax=Aureobasidium namibiae CBS 147.97 TaxID=1043004 RepID=A0A074W6E4_9PEZI|nr:uncharacterized protein M436DRAFT_86250 [Aureobasidium namibiae CBS 147.97]KEQ68685.1 hypothetical protein M436DRAFT_86250 [Aureobasidium namibiae CBS 147.97]
MTPETPCAHAAPLLAASLPTKPALPAISAAIARLCEVLGQFTRDYPNMQIPTLFSQFSLGVAFALLPSVSISSPFFLPSASQNLIMILRLLQRAWKLVPVIKYGALSIKQAASQMCTSIPYEAEAIFASLELEIALDKAKDKMSAAWVVDPSTSDVGYQGGRVDDLIKDLNGLNI